MHSADWLSHLPNFEIRQIIFCQRKYETSIEWSRCKIILLQSLHKMCTGLYQLFICYFWKKRTVYNVSLTHSYLTNRYTSWWKAHRYYISKEICWMYIDTSHFLASLVRSIVNARSEIWKHTNVYLVTLFGI